MAGVRRWVERTSHVELNDDHDRLTDGALSADSPIERISELEDGLKRISHEVENLGLGSHRGNGVDAVAAVAEANLTTRQREVVQRLVEGERVPAIARALFLSQSTVRNHLLAVYRLLGVHSQETLIEYFKADSAEPSDSM